MMMSYLNKPIINSIATKRIISFELANTLKRSQEIIASWGPFAMVFVGIALGFDFLYVLIYPLLVAITMYKIYIHLWSKHFFYTFGELLIWSLLVATIFDLKENVCLTQILTENREHQWVLIGYYSATIKFLLIPLSSLYMAINSIRFLTKKYS